MSTALESLRRLQQERQADELPGSDLPWLDTLRRHALACFEEQDIPSRRLEEWKGTNFAPLAAMQFDRVGRNQNSVTVEHGDLGDGPLLVFVDGEFDRDDSRLTDLPTGVRALSLAEAFANEPDLIENHLASLTDLKVQPLVALQTAFLSDGAVLSIAPDTRVDQPIRLRFVSTGNEDESVAAAFPRLLVVVGQGSSLSLIQEHVSVDSAPGLTAYVAEFHLAEGARVESLEIQAEEAARIHFTSAHARLEQSASFDSHVITVGNGLVRSELTITLAEPDAETTLCGLFMGRDSAHLDHFTTVDHAAERCSSDEEYRGVLANDSKGVFRGRVIVRPGAQKTDAKQSNPNLLLSDGAMIDTKPQLEIYADDIKASHGSTIGQLDSDALFFLRARGIDLENAKRLLTRAFAHGVIARIENDELRRVATGYVDANLRHLMDLPLTPSDAPADRISR